MASFDQWRSRLIGQLPGILESTCQELWNAAAIDFCRRTGVYLQDITDTVPAGTTSYELTADDGCAIVRIEAITYPDGWTARLPPQSAPGVVKLPWPTQSDLLLTFTLSVMPPLDASAEVPDWFATFWHEALVDGTMGLACAQINKPYSNLIAATTHTQRFDGQIATAAGYKRNQYGAQGPRLRRKFA